VLSWLLSLRPRVRVSIGSEIFRLGLGRDYEDRWLW
jgi:hypothetical protein